MTQLQQTDTWQANVYRQLKVAQAAILDLIDIGPSDGTVTPRNPSKTEILATDRADGNFQPTPKAAGRQSGTSDPTLRQVLAWEAEVQNAVTGLFEVVSAAVEVAAWVTPTDGNGDDLEPPTEPPVRETLSGRRIIDSAVASMNRRTVDCRRATIAAVTYIGATVDAVAGLMLETDGDEWDRARSLAGWLAVSLERLARRLAPEPVRRCANPECRAAAPPKGKGATCGRCRTKRWRQNQAS